MGQQVWPSTKDMLMSSVPSANGSRLARSGSPMWQGSFGCRSPVDPQGDVRGKAEQTSCAVAEGFT